MVSARYSLPFCSELHLNAHEQHPNNLDCSQRGAGNLILGRARTQAARQGSFTWLVVSHCGFETSSGTCVESDASTYADISLCVVLSIKCKP